MQLTNPKTSAAIAVAVAILGAVAFAAAGCGGYSGDRPYDQSSGLNGTNGNGTSLSGIPGIAGNMAAGWTRAAWVWTSTDNGATAMSAVDATGKPVVGPSIPVPVGVGPVVWMGQSAQFLFAAKDAKSGLFGLYRGPRLDVAIATQVVPPTLTSVSQIAAVNSHTSAFVIAPGKDGKGQLFRLPPDVRTPIKVGQADFVSINPKRKLIALIQNGSLSIANRDAAVVGVKGIPVATDVVQAAWSQDGSTLAYFVKLKDGGAAIASCDFQGKNAKAIMKTKVNAPLAFGFDPKGKRILLAFRLAGEKTARGEWIDVATGDVTKVSIPDGLTSGQASIPSKATPIAAQLK